MSTWDISPDGVSNVLTLTQAVAISFEGQMTSLQAALEETATHSSSEIVGTALQGFMDSVQSDIQFVFTRTSACINAAAQATNAYLGGDLEMAANVQATATGAPDAASMPGRGGGGTVPR